MSFDIKLNTSRLSHAYITDASNAGELSMAVVCSAREAAGSCGICAHCNKASRNIHPDIIEVSRLDNKLIISVDQIRALKQDVYVLPNEAAQKVYVVKEADLMNTNAQNAFLQILEEPPAHVFFVLCTDNPAALLPTVRSRCVELKSPALEAVVYDSDELEGLEKLADDFVEALTGVTPEGVTPAGDNIKLMECMFRLDKLDRQAFYTFLTQAREHVVFALRESANERTQFAPTDKREALIKAETVLEKAAEMLDLNVSAGHVSGYICASIIV